MKVHSFYGTRNRTRMQRNGVFQEEISTYVYKELPNNANSDGSDDDDEGELDQIQMEVEEDVDDVDYGAKQEEVNGIHPSEADANADASASVSSNLHESISGEHCRWRKREPEISPHDFLGSQFSLPEKVLTPLEYFKNFFSNDLMDHIAEQTNIYCIQEKIKKN
ncbi:UNVERIFIED_CONTAM: hypothetical protein RMT77_013870 [Armadillidium vulgare]